MAKIEQCIGLQLAKVVLHNFTSFENRNNVKKCTPSLVCTIPD